MSTSLELGLSEAWRTSGTRGMKRKGKYRGFREGQSESERRTEEKPIEKKLNAHVGVDTDLMNARARFGLRSGRGTV